MWNWILWFKGRILCDKNSSKLWQKFVGNETKSDSPLSKRLGIIPKCVEKCKNSWNFWLKMDKSWPQLWHHLGRALTRFGISLRADLGGRFRFAPFLTLPEWDKKHTQKHRKMNKNPQMLFFLCFSVKNMLFYFLEQKWILHE